MSFKQLPGTRSFSVVNSGTAAPVIQIDRHDKKLHKSIPTMVLQLTLEALRQFICDIACIIAESLIAAFAWLFREFLTGCATYAEAMYPIQAAMDERDSSLKHAEPGRASPMPTAPRLRLVVVSDTAQDGSPSHDQLPLRQATTTSGRVTLRDWASSQDIESIHSGKALAARRKNRPR